MSKNIDKELDDLEEETKGEPPVTPPFADEEETHRELSNIIWGIFILTFCTQVLSAFTYLLTNPEATWEAVLVMIIMAAQGTIFGGAIKMLTKKQEYVQNKLDKEKQNAVTTGLERDNLSDKVEVLEKDNKRVNTDLDNAHAEILGLKKRLFVEESPENTEIKRLQKEITDLENKE